ncbi:DDE-type integrase/transposase/recombinase [Roseibium sp. RKSG952]|uniref:DDE-type integrase/transposase/recombinase n=1 Tax=Roseibium sp. RKSG952 TaxID=2529384 RepID=UPI0034CF6499
MVPARVQSKKQPTLKSWPFNENYLRVLGKRKYLYRAVDKAGKPHSVRNWIMK